jgi:AcrR family transcriptional regulator
MAIDADSADRLMARHPIVNGKRQKMGALTDLRREARARPSVSPWTAREAEFLATTLRLLQLHGYDGLTVEAVAVEAKSSKATIYRRWPSKADLVVAAFVEGTRMEEVPPKRNSLRLDLLQIGDSLCEQACQHASTMRAVLTEVSRSPALSAAFQDVFIQQPKLLIADALAEAADREEVGIPMTGDEAWDLLPGYLVFRSLMSGRPPTCETVRALVDDVLMPSLIRGPRALIT